MTVSPERGYEIISKGKRGTLMPAFAPYPKGLRWAHVEHVRAIYMRAIPEERENSTVRGRNRATERTSRVTFDIAASQFLVRELNLPPSGKKEINKL